MNVRINLELIADSVRVTSTGMDEVVVNIMNIDVDDILNQISIKDVIEHYTADSVLAELESRLNEKN